MYTSLVPLSQDTIGQIHAQAARSIFWELDADTATTVLSTGDPAFEKEAWLARVLINYGCCGFSLIRPETRHTIATVLYCSRTDAPGANQLPTAPVSDDAELLTSLYIDPGFAGIGLESVLLDAAIMELTDKDASAVEAFGWRSDFFTRTDVDSLLRGPVGDLLRSAPEIGLVSVPVLESAGFRVVADHPVLPRLRLELPPQHDLLSAADVEELLTRASVC